jgi:hypothetical protein
VIFAALDAYGVVSIAAACALQYRECLRSLEAVCLRRGSSDGGGGNERMPDQRPTMESR